MVNKKGFTQQLFLVIAVCVFLLIITVGYYFFSLIAPLLTSVSNDFTVSILSAPDTNNLTTYLNYTVGAGNRVVQQTQWLSYGIIFMMMISFITMCFYVRTMPFLLGVWILMGFIIMFISIQLASTYQTVSLGTDYTGLAYQSWTGNHYILQYYPWIVGALWITGAIIMFSLITQDKEGDLTL